MNPTKELPVKRLPSSGARRTSRDSRFVRQTWNSEFVHGDPRFVQIPGLRGTSSIVSSPGPGGPIGRFMCRLPYNDVHATIDDVDVAVALLVAPHADCHATTSTRQLTMSTRRLTIST